MNRLSFVLHKVWVLLRHLSGDDAYERYLQYWRHNHADVAPLNRVDFQRIECERRWNGIRRCC